MNLRQAAALAAVLTFGAATAAFAEVTPAPSASPAAAAQPVPGIPASITNNPYIQSAIQAIGGLFQTTNGNAAHGTVTYFRRFELQLETAPRVYRQIHLHQGTV
ncbi:MAG: hypothetical protein ACREM8_13130, partial [Vulcanimicrobiaceae bacterium]